MVLLNLQRALLASGSAGFHCASNIRDTGPSNGHLVVLFLYTLKVKNMTDINQYLNGEHLKTPNIQVTSSHHSLQNDKRGEEEENDRRDKKRIKGEEKETPEWSPLRHSLPQNRNHAETELTYKDTTKVLGVLTTCLVCLKHAAIKGALEVMRGGSHNTIQN